MMGSDLETVAAYRAVGRGAVEGVVAVGALEKLSLIGERGENIHLKMLENHMYIFLVLAPVDDLGGHIALGVNGDLGGGRACGKKGDTDGLAIGRKVESMAEGEGTS